MKTPALPANEAERLRALARYEVPRHTPGTGLRRPHRRALGKAKELERRAREGDLDSAASLFADLVEETARLEEALRGIRQRRPSRMSRMP